MNTEYELAQLNELNFFIKEGLSDTLKMISEQFGYVVIYNNDFLLVEEKILNDNKTFLKVFELLKNVSGVSILDTGFAPSSLVYQKHTEQLKVLERIDNNAFGGNVEKSGKVQEQFNKFIEDAVALGATDIHMSITADSQAEVYYRVNGVIETTPLIKSQTECFSIIGNCFEWAGAENSTDKNFNKDKKNDTSLHDIPIHINGNKSTVEVRVHYRSLTINNKICTFRVLNVNSNILSLDVLGLNEAATKVLGNCMKIASGLIMISGPTGSGKSTLLVSVINNKPKDKVMHTLEDPIETDCPDKLTFQGLQSENPEDDIKEFMRCDLDIGCVAETRTGAQVKSALGLARTGHLMISTLHANDAISQIERLIDMGIKRSELAEKNLIRILTAQRLVPLLCQKCKVPFSDHDIEELSFIGSEASIFKLEENKSNIYKRNDMGCKSCNHTGLAGRKMVFEYIVIDEAGRSFIRNDNMAGWVEHLKKHGWKSMADNAWDFLLSGQVDPFIADGIVPDLILDSNKPYIYRG
jgi:type II secretory ATPase GspE/PulE/Tfp pilus assembly ATPase PilB-like protein